MSISNFAGLKAAVRSFAGRNDQPFISAIGGLVELAEQRIAYGGGAPMPSEAVRVRDQETSADIDVVDGVGVIPADSLEFRRLYWLGSLNLRLTYIDPEQYYTILDGNVSGGDPRWYSIEGASLLIAPITTGTAKLLYWKRYAALSDDADSNWLLLNAPQIYLQSVLVECGQRFGDGDMAATALQQYQSAVSGLMTTENRSRVSGTLLRPVMRW